MTWPTANRVVAPEWLDQLPAHDPLAMASRRDLRRLNFFMGNAKAIGGALFDIQVAKQPLRLAELGAGDGTFFLRFARALGSRRRGEIFLVDRRPCVSNETAEALGKLGWTVKTAAADVFDWLPGQSSLDAVMANLFLHHFEPNRLAALLELISKSARCLAACEPRRGLAALSVSSMLRLIGCNCVTRHDAPVSVRAGFRGNELSSLWPAPHWNLFEQRSGLFSHLFVARKER